MIIESLLNLIFKMAEKTLSILPDASSGISEFISGGIGFFTKLIGGLSYWLPLEALMIMLGIVLLVQNFQLILWIVNWVIRRIADIIP